VSGFVCAEHIALWERGKGTTTQNLTDGTLVTIFMRKPALREAGILPKGGILRSLTSGTARNLRLLKWRPSQEKMARETLLNGRTRYQNQCGNLRMATDRQIAASRRNGSLGRGSKSPAGKARSSRNALKHGLSIPVQWRKALTHKEPAQLAAYKN
jgi:hypothetical protein